MAKGKFKKWIKKNAGKIVLGGAGIAATVFSGGAAAGALGIVSKVSSKLKKSKVGGILGKAVKSAKNAASESVGEDVANITHASTNENEGVSETAKSFSTGYNSAVKQSQKKNLPVIIAGIVFVIGLILLIFKRK